MTGKLYVRDLFLVEALSENGQEDIDNLAELAENGDVSLLYELIESDGVSADFMAGLLTAQASDPAFLLGEPPASPEAPETPEGSSMPEGA